MMGAFAPARTWLAALERQEVTRVGQELAADPLEDGKRIYADRQSSPLRVLAPAAAGLLQRRGPWRPQVGRHTALSGSVRVCQDNEKMPLFP